MTSDDIIAEGERRNAFKPGGEYRSYLLPSQELQTILADHSAWLQEGGPEGDPRRADLSYCDLRLVHLPGCNLKYANLVGANLEGAELSKSDLQGADLRGATFARAELKRAQLKNALFEGGSFRGANLEEAVLSQAVLKEVDFQEANLRRAGLWGVNLSRSNLQKSDLSEALVGRSILHSANFRGANLTKANLVDSSFRQANLQGATLVKSDLKGASFEKARLWGANFKEAELSNANLTEADLLNASFLGANLQQSNLSSANLKGASFKEADLTGTKLHGVKGWDSVDRTNAKLTWAEGIPPDRDFFYWAQLVFGPVTVLVNAFALLNLVDEINSTWIAWAGAFQGLLGFYHSMLHQIVDPIVNWFGSFVRVTLPNWSSDFLVFYGLIGTSFLSAVRANPVEHAAEWRLMLERRVLMLITSSGIWWIWPYVVGAFAWARIRRAPTRYEPHVRSARNFLAFTLAVVAVLLITNRVFLFLESR